MSVILRSPARIIFAFALAAFLAGCGNGSSPTAPTQMNTPVPANVVITINGISGNMSFAPTNATVKVGQTVSWHNADTITHAIAQDSVGGFTTGTIPGGSTSAPVMISAAGSMPYHCTIHPSMTGTLTGQ